MRLTEILGSSRAMLFLFCIILLNRSFGLYKYYAMNQNMDAYLRISPLMVLGVMIILMYGTLKSNLLANRSLIVLLVILIGTKVFTIWPFHDLHIVIIGMLLVVLYAGTIASLYLNSR